MMQTGKTAS